MFNFRMSRSWPQRGVACVLLVGALCGCQRSSEKKAAAVAEGPRSLQVTPVQSHDLPQMITVQGSLLGDELATVGVKVAGRVDKVEVDVGTRVQRGDRLAVLDLVDFEVKVKQAKAEEASTRARLGLKPGQDPKHLDRTQTPTVVQERALVEGARASYERAVSLARGNATSAEELQVSHTALKVAEARYNSALHLIDEQIALLDMRTNAVTLAEHALADATIAAPFNGIVAARNVAPGVYLQVGDPVVTLVRTDPLRFHAGVPERHSLLVEPGQQVLITVEGQTSPLIGKISRVSPILDLASRSLSIEVDIPNPDLRLRAGLFAEAEIVVNPRAHALVVPRSALIEFAGVKKVYVVEDGKAALRRVVTGRALGDQVEIVEGLRLAEQVAIEGKTARPGPAIAVRLPSSPIAAKTAAP